MAQAAKGQQANLATRGRAEEKSQRLQSIVYQLQAISASTEVGDALSRFATEQLCAERDQLLMAWPQGAWERRAMEARARSQLEQQ